jgi:hypothetical protein
MAFQEMLGLERTEGLRRDRSNGDDRMQDLLAALVQAQA